MDHHARLAAAQYIRMSTETQTLSPAMQKHAISAYAAAQGLSLVASYEDEGRSGLTLKNRREMRRLLRDVAEDECPFSVVLVYDVSRWGRFPDTDESAYYEFHCRMHGVQVVYVNEPFEAAHTPTLAILKALKRAMAAEFSRELALKVAEAQRRAISLGYQLGRLPCIGVDRLAISPDGNTRALADKERPRKGERVSWVHGPDHEVALIRRIFQEYTVTAITLNSLTAKVNSEGHTARGAPFTRTMLRSLISSEIWYGEFVWGRRKSGARKQRRQDDDPRIHRFPGVMAPIVTRDLWEKAQQKLKEGFHAFGHTKDTLLRELRAALARNPKLTGEEMGGYGCASRSVYRKAFGSIREAMRLAGRSDAALAAVYMERKSRAHATSNQFGRDLRQLLTQAGIPWVRPGKDQLLVIGGGLRLRYKLLWQMEHRRGWRWHFNRLPSGPFDYILFVPVGADNRASELLLLTRLQYQHLRTWFDSATAAIYSKCSSSSELVEQLHNLIETDCVAARATAASATPSDSCAR